MFGDGDYRPASYGLMFGDGMTAIIELNVNPLLVQEAN
jgi:hypothetical protein